MALLLRTYPSTPAPRERHVPLPPTAGRRPRSPRPGAMGAASRADRAAHVRAADEAAARPRRDRPVGHRPDTEPDPRPCLAWP
ncbi:hypothetical protein ACFQL8_29200, partial [Streptomyces goshikiensis]|uniref:hypothetical protein n=1 Tax=Streptomyces goshikiensis TaxID=1942 RepID=UPI00360E829B